MSVSLRRLLSRLAAIALSATSVAAAEPVSGAPDALPTTDRGDGDAEPDIEDLDAALQIDRELIDPPDAAAAIGRGLALATHRMRPIVATHVFATWALSEDPVRRLAVAHALGWEFPLVGDSVVIDHLSRDLEPMVREASARAAWTRQTRGGDAGVLDRLRDDPDASVRDVAQRAR